MTIKQSHSELPNASDGYQHRCNKCHKYVQDADTRKTRCLYVSSVSQQYLLGLAKKQLVINFEALCAHVTRPAICAIMLVFEKPQDCVKPCFGVFTSRPQGRANYAGT